MYLLTRKHTHSMLWFARFAIFCTLLAIFTAGCKDHPKDKLREGRAALAAKNPDLAETRLNEALQADPNMIEARRLMIDVHLLRDDYPRAEESLLALWNNLGFDRPVTQIPPEERSNRQLMADQFNDLYRRWAENISPTEEPEKFEEVVKKGIERNPRSARLNTMLVDFYKEQAEKLLERGEKLKAAEKLEQIPDLLTLPTTRQAAITRAETLRREAFMDAALARFEAELKPDLLASQQFDAERNAVLLTLAHPVSRRLLPANPEDRAQALAQTREALTPLIAELAAKIGNLPPDTDPAAFAELPYEIRSENFVRGTFTLVAAIPLTNILELSYRFHEAARLAAEQNPDNSNVPQNDTTGDHDANPSHDPDAHP